MCCDRCVFSFVFCRTLPGPAAIPTRRAPIVQKAGLEDQGTSSSASSSSSDSVQPSFGLLPRSFDLQSWLTQPGNAAHLARLIQTQVSPPTATGATVTPTRTRMSPNPLPPAAGKGASATSPKKSIFEGSDVVMKEFAEGVRDVAKAMVMHGVDKLHKTRGEFTGMSNYMLITATFCRCEFISLLCACYFVCRRGHENFRRHDDPSADT